MKKRKIKFKNKDIKKIVKALFILSPEAMELKVKYFQKLNKK